MTPDQNLSELFKVIGSLGSKLDAVAENQARVEKQVDDMDRRSSDSRSKLYEKVESVAQTAHGAEGATTRMEVSMKQTSHTMRDIQDRVGQLEIANRNNTDAIEEMKPSADLVRKWEQRGIGIGIALTTLGLMFGAALGTFRDKLFALFVD